MSDKLWGTHGNSVADALIQAAEKEWTDWQWVVYFGGHLFASKEAAIRFAREHSRTGMYRLVEGRQRGVDSPFVYETRCGSRFCDAGREPGNSIPYACPAYDISAPTDAQVCPWAT